MVTLVRPWFRSIGRPALVATALIVLVCGTVLAIEGWRIVDTRSGQIAEARTASLNLAKSVADTTTGTFVQADLVLTGLVERLETDGSGPAAIERLHRLLRARKTSLPFLQRLSILDRDGHWITTDMPESDRSVSHTDREYFQFHAQNDDRAPHLGPPIRSKSTNEWIVTVSRRFNDREGRFAGVVLASVSLAWFSAYFDQFDIGHDGTILLVMSNGNVVHRRPFLEKAINTNLADGPLFREHIAYDDRGTAWIRGRFDGVQRLVAFNKAELFPIYAVASFARDEVLHPWLLDTLTRGAAVLTFLTVIALVGWWLVRQTIRRHRDQLLLVESGRALAETNERLEALVREDGLTGIANRREFDRVLTEELTRASRRRSSLALLMIDVDHFKAYNDAHGHLEGDDCLRRVAGLVGARASRPGDVAARYGGEEFVVLLPETDVVGARRVAEKLRTSLHTLAMPHARSPSGIVTVSIGVAALAPDRLGFCATTLIERADRALYAAKDGGRDAIRVIDADDLLVDAPLPTWTMTTFLGRELETIV